MKYVSGADGKEGRWNGMVWQGMRWKGKERKGKGWDGMDGMAWDEIGAKMSVAVG